MGKFVVKQAKSGYRFNLVAGNGEIIATSQTYAGKASCLEGLESVHKNAPDAALEDQTVEGYLEQKHPKFEIYLDKAGEFRFRLKARNGEISLAEEQGSRCGPGGRVSCEGGLRHFFEQRFPCRRDGGKPVCLALPLCLAGAHRQFKTLFAGDPNSTDRDGTGAGGGEPAPGSL